MQGASDPCYTVMRQRRQAMRTFILALLLTLIAAPALAETITAAEAKNHIDKDVTVEGVVSEVHHAASGRAIFIEIGGRYPSNPFSAVIFKDHFNKFPTSDSLAGKTVDVTGRIKDYRGRAEIILDDPEQLKVK
jgi:DNA/RNA endonuclease YhcR with UshA esterase domain